MRSPMLRITLSPSLNSDFHNLQQQQMRDMSSMSQMYPNNPYLQAVAFGGGAGSMNPGGGNPYMGNAFGAQAYMQGNPAFSMLGMFCSLFCPAEYSELLCF